MRNGEINFDQLLCCVKMLMFEDGSIEGYPYYLGGTGFLIQFRSYLYLITARHCLNNNMAQPEQICVLPHPASQDFLPYDVIHGPMGMGLRSLPTRPEGCWMACAPL